MSLQKTITQLVDLEKKYRNTRLKVFHEGEGDTPQHQVYRWLGTCTRSLIKVLRRMEAYLKYVKWEVK